MSEARHHAIGIYYRTLFSAWGRQHWWPAQSRFEVIVGAYLTQNTAWTNVEKALRNLRRARLLTISGIRRTPPSELEQLIRSAGYFRQKAQRLKTFVQFLDQHYGGSLARMCARPTADLRDELLALNGAGVFTTGAQRRRRLAASGGPGRAGASGKTISVECQCGPDAGAGF